MVLMNNRKKMSRVVFSSILCAISIIIRISVEFLDGNPFFTIPFYAIPLVIASVLYGPLFGLVCGFIVDSISAYIIGYDYVFFAALVPICWGVMSGLFVHIRKKISFKWLLLGIFVAHIMATYINSFVMLVMFNVPLNTVLVRLIFIPSNIVIIAIISYHILRGLEKNEIY